MAEREADFYIKYLYEFKLFGQNFYLTTTHVCLLIVDIVIVILALLVRKKVMAHKPGETPGMLQNIFEMVVEFVDNMVKGIMGANAPRFRNYIGTILLFVLICNISGIFGLRPPTADYSITFPLGIMTFLMINYCGFKKNKIGHITELFKPTPILFPINLIGELAVPLSLSLRLFGNVLSGTVMMGLIYGLLSPPITTGIPAFLHIYFDLFSGVIQAYVFSMLTMVYISNKIAD